MNDSHSEHFRTTRWSLVRAASGRNDEQAARALAEVCGCYRGPLLAFTRATVSHPQDAEDFVQGFFEKLLERKFLATADPSRGKLRTFLLTCLKRHITDEFRKQSAAKRGGGQEQVPLDEARAIASPAPGPDELYHRQWTLLLLTRAVNTLRDSWITNGKGELFDALKPMLGFAADEDADRAALAARLGISKGTLKTTLYRFRKDYRETLMQEIAYTLEEKTPDEIMEEMKELMLWV